MYTQQDRNVRKTWILMSLFLIIVIGLGWTFSRIYGDPIILYIAVIFSIGMNVISFWYSDKIVLKISGAKTLEKKDNPELYQITENLCITAGLPLPKIYIIDDLAPNAFATGRNKERAVIAVTRGLLKTLDRSELEGVISHEISHIGNRDILISTIVVVLVGFIALLSDFFLRMTIWERGGRRKGDEKMHLIMLLIGIALAILAPIIAILIQLAISRKREFLADASGSLLTRYPEGLALALEKISQNSAPLKRANKATAHLYIASPFKGKKAKGWLTKAFMTHPPMQERIKALRQM